MVLCERGPGGEEIQMNTATKPLKGILTYFTSGGIGAGPDKKVEATFYGPIKPQGRFPAKYAILVHSTGEMLELEATSFRFVPDEGEVV